MQLKLLISHATVETDKKQQIHSQAIITIVISHQFNTLISQAIQHNTLIVKQFNTLISHVIITYSTLGGGGRGFFLIHEYLTS